MEYEPTDDDLQQLREWLRKMPHLLQDYDDQFLKAFIRVCKGSLQKTKRAIEKGNAMGVEYPEYFGTYDPLHPPLQDFLSTWMMFPLPKKTSDDCTVIFMCLNPDSKDASKSHLVESSKYLFFTWLVLVWEDKFGSGKVKFVCDVKGVSLTHVSDMTPMDIKRLIRILELTQIFRIQLAAAFNMPTYLEHFFNLFKLVSKTKLAERIFAYSTLDKVAEHIPQKMLPKEYGGSEESVFVLHDDWKNKIESYRERFLEKERKMRSLDSIRPPSGEKDEMMVGTFRQLTVD